MAKKQKQNTYGAIGAIAGLARAGKDAGTVRNKKAPKKERQKAQKRLKAYSSGNKSVYVPKQARTTNRQAKLQTIQKAQQKTAPKSITEKKPELTAYQKYQNALKQHEKVKADQAVKKAKLPLSNKAYKEQQNQAKKEVKRVQSNYTLTGLKKNTEQAGISAKKAQERAKKEKPTQISNDTALKAQYLSRIPKALRDKGVGDNLLTAKEKKQIQTNIQADYDRGSIGTGFMSGSMPVAKLKEATESAYGIKLDDSKGKEKLGYKIGEAAGYLAKSTLFGGAGEAAVGKALTKVIARKTGKQVTSKAAKFGINRASEAIASAPVNVEDAAKNSKNTKEFAQNLAVNAALDAGLGSTVDVVKAAGRAAKTAKAKTIHSAIQKTLKGQNLTESEATALAKVKKRAEKKRESGKPLTTAERLAKKAAARGQAVKQTPVKAAAQQAEQTVAKSVKQTKAVRGKTLAKPETKTAYSDYTIKDFDRQLKADNEVLKVSEETGKSRKAVAENMRRDSENTFEREVQKLADYVYHYKGKGAEAHLVPTDKIPSVGGGEPFRTMQRSSNNDIIYQEVLKAYGKKPSKAQAREFAEEKIQEDIERYKKTGETHYIDPEDIRTILRSEDLDGVSHFKEVADSGAIQGLKLSDGMVQYVYQGKNPNLQKGTAKRLAEKTDLPSASNADVDPEPTAREAKASLLDKSISDSSQEINKKEAPQLLNMPKDPQPTSKTPDVSASAKSISAPQAKSNGSKPISDETLYNHAKKMRENGFSDADIEEQFYKMGIDPQKSADILDRKTVSGSADGKPHETKAEELKSHNPKEYYKSATGGITDEEVSQHYAKLSAQIMEDVSGNENVFEALKFGEQKGMFGKAKGMSQEEALKQANAEIAADFDKCYRDFMDMDGFSDDPHLFEARGAALYDRVIKDINEHNLSAESGKSYLELVEKATEFASMSGRALNAVKMILRTTPQGRVRVMDKEVKRLGARFADRLEGKELKLSEDQINRMVKAETDEEVKKVISDINTEIWDQIPVTAFEKINEVRHCFMLFNVKTHLRNMTGNEAFRQARNMSDCIEIGLNKLFKNRIESLGGNVDMVRVPRKDIRANSEYLDEVFEQVYQESGSVSRYVESYRPENSRVVKNGAMNKVIQANYNLLDKEDRTVFRPAFKKNYVRWCKSHGIDAGNMKNMTSKQKAAASEYAMRQAEIATFRDASALSNFITGKKSLLAGKKGKTKLGTAAYRTGNMLLESQLPFVKTPINVFRRSVDYSPIGLLRGLGELMNKKDPEIVKQGIHHLATGLTGTALCAFGAWMSSNDMITLKANEVSGDAYYDRDMGYQDYSLVLQAGGKEYSLTIDWASPMNVSLFMGAQMEQDLSEKDNLTLTGMLKGLQSISGPMLDMSFMSTAKDTISMFQEQAFRKAEDEDIDYTGAMVQTLFGSLPQGYLSSFVPQLVTQSAQAFDSKQRDTRSTAEDPLVKSWESWERKLINRVPGLRNYLLNPKLDRFGNDKETGNNLLLRMMNAYVNPSNMKEIHFTKLDREIIQIYNHMPTDTQDERKDKKYFFYNFTGNPSYDLGEGKRMSYGEAYQYGKQKRRQQTTLIEDMAKAKSYQDMTWNMKAEEVGNAHWISQAVADRDTYGYHFAAERIAKADWEKKNLKAYKGLGGGEKGYVDFYINSRKMYARAHNNDRYDYYTKALAVVKYGDKKLAKVYDINMDKIDNAKEYLKKGGSVKEYSNAMCQVMSGIDKAGVSSSIKNMAISAADFQINKRTRKAMGLTKDKSNMGIGLKKFGYTYESLENMRMDCKYQFDKDKSGSLSKSEVIDYVNSLGLKKNAEKACVFEYLYNYSGANPWGIPNYLDMEEDEPSKGGSWGYRRYGRRYRRYGRRRSGRGSGGSSGSTSSVSDETALEKYERALKAQPKVQKVSVSKVQSAKSPRVSTGSGQVAKKASYTRKRSSKLDINAYGSDALRKAVVKQLAKQLKG